MSSLNAPTPIITTYAELRQAIAARRKELGLSQLALDEIAGVQSGYTAKLEAGIKNFGDMSFGAVMGALGLSLSPTKSSESHCETWTKAQQNEKERRKRNGRKGGIRAALRLTAEERRSRAKKGGKKSWRNWRQVKAEKAARERRAKKKAAAEAPPGEGHSQRRCRALHSV